MKVAHYMGAYAVVGLFVIGTLIRVDTSYCPKQPRRHFLFEIVAVAIWPAIIAIGPFAAIKCSDD